MFCTGFPTLPGYHGINRSHNSFLELMFFCTQSNDPAHTLFLSHYRVSVIASACLPLLFPYLRLSLLLPRSAHPPTTSRGSLSCRLV